MKPVALSKLLITLEQSPIPKVARIREDECIGCTKCIQACPFDSIVGAAKQMHTVLERDCTGCELCVAPCPVDCIDMVNLASLTLQEKKENTVRFTQRYEAHSQRIEKIQKEKREKHLSATLRNDQSTKKSVTDRKKAIEAVLARVKLKTHDKK